MLKNSSLKKLVISILGILTRYLPSSCFPFIVKYPEYTISSHTSLADRLFPNLTLSVILTATFSWLNIFSRVSNPSAPVCCNNSFIIKFELVFIQYDFNSLFFTKFNILQGLYISLFPKVYPSYHLFTSGISYPT